MKTFYVFRELESRPWWQALVELERALGSAENATTERAGLAAVEERVAERYVTLVNELIAQRKSSLGAATAEVLLEGEAALTGDLEGEIPPGLRLAALMDLQRVRRMLGVDWQGRSQAVAGRALAPLRELAPVSDCGEFEAWSRRLTEEEPSSLLESLRERYGREGTGVLSRYRAFRWRAGALEGVERPAGDRLEELVGLESQLDRLTQNVERFLAGAPALHALLYGPRGSGKSTAVRGLLNRYGERGLRLVEIAPESLADLPALGERLRSGPHRYLAFVDDLSFETGDAAYHPLKTLLEGSVAQRPENLLLVATSNRRHLVRESFSDRPLPENDDVHAWDTSNERLALADRFGLVITFPAADQKKYLTMVRELARNRGVDTGGADLEAGAIRFADWGNGYSGRTARQFVDTLG